MSAANVVDSSGWLEYFLGSARAVHFEEAIWDAANLFVPTITIYEVFKRILRDRDESEAQRLIRLMGAGKAVSLDAALARAAARYRLSLADSIIYATAQRHDATLWTQDEHFKDLPGVRYFPKQASV